MNLVKILIAAIAASALVSFTVAVVRAKRQVDKAAKEAEEEFLKTAQDLRHKVQREKFEEQLNSSRSKEIIDYLDRVADGEPVNTDYLEESIMDQPAIKVGGKNKVDPLTFAKSIRPEDILPV